MTLFSHRSDAIQTTFWPRQDSGATCNHEDSIGSNLGDKLEIPQAHLSFSVQCLSEAVGLQPFNSSASNACWKTSLMIAFLYSFLSRYGMQSPVLSLYDTFFIRLYLFLEHLFCPTVPSIPPPTSSYLPSLLISFKIESCPFSYLHLLHGLFYFFRRMKNSWFTMLCLFQVYRKVIQLCIYIYIHILFHILFCYGLLQDIESSSLTLLFICFIYRSVYLLIPNS